MIIQWDCRTHLDMLSLSAISSLTGRSIPEEFADMLEYQSLYRVASINIVFSAVMGLGCILCTRLRSKTLTHRDVLLNEGEAEKENPMKWIVVVMLLNFH